MVEILSSYTDLFYDSLKRVWAGAEDVNRKQDLLHHIKHGRIAHGSALQVRYKDDSETADVQGRERAVKYPVEVGVRIPLHSALSVG